MAEYPPHKAAWERRAQYMLHGFQARYESSKTNLKKLLDFINGDTSQDIARHFCLLPADGRPPCCNSDEDSLCKFLAMAVPWFSKGFATPLLYRMKHYGPASSYAKVGCMFCNLLPRVFQELQNNSADAEVTNLVDVFMNEPGQAQHEPRDTEQLLANILDADTSYTAQNSVRKKLILNQVSKPDFPQSAMLVDCWTQPLEHGTNYLLSHTKTQTELKYLSKASKNFEALCQKSKSQFLEFMAGGLSDKILMDYAALLDCGMRDLLDMGFEPTPERLNRILVAMVAICSDIYRRLKFEFTSAPFTLFALVGMDTPNFLRAWADLEHRGRCCDSCHDHSLTAALLRQFPDLTLKSPVEQDAARSQAQELLSDIATWSPLCSDSVELKHGQVQWLVSRRGAAHVLGERAAAESSFLKAAINQNVWMRWTADLGCLSGVI